MKKSYLVFVSAALTLGAACSSSSAKNGSTTPHDGGSSSSSGGSTSSGGGSGGGQTCTIDNPSAAEDFCYTIVTGESCSGTLGSAPCPVGVGCCVQPTQTMCYLNEADSPGPLGCSGTWVTPDAGASGDDGGPATDSGGNDPFLGTWTGNITLIATCGDAGATTTSRADTLDITAGSAPGTIHVKTPSNDCTFVFDVNGDTATAESGQVCDEKASDGGLIETLTVHDRTLTFSGAGSPALTSTGSSTIVKGNSTCNDQESGTYTE
jgi:hypothetical protein